MNYSELSIPGEIEFSLVELNSGEKLETVGNMIVTVVDGIIGKRKKGILNTFDSSVYHTGEIEAKKDSLLTVFDIKELNQILNKIDVNENFGEYCRSNWKQLRDLYDVDGFEKVDLYRGNQIEKEFNGTKYKFNLWFCGPNVDCLFHNQHDFVEVHTNIAGDGNMQKALDSEGEELLETVNLGIGATHRKFNIENEFEENGNPKYPFHRWLGGNTGNIWLVIEKY